MVENLGNIENLTKQFPEKFAIHDILISRHPQLEYSIHDWTMGQQFSEIPMSSIDAIDKAASPNPNFKDHDKKEKFVGYTIL